MSDEWVEYEAPSGERISKYKDGPRWDENRWTKIYNNEAEAIIEFER